MSIQVEISLVGAGSYGTLKKVFQKGTPFIVTQEEWRTLRDERNPSTGEKLFCLTSDLPSPATPVVQASDLVTAGLGEIDTGSVVNTLDILKEPSVVDLGEEDFPEGVKEPEAPVPAAAHPDHTPSPRKLHVGKGKAVTV